MRIFASLPVPRSFARARTILSAFHGRGQWKVNAGSPVRSAGAILGSQRPAFGLDNETLLVLECSSQGLAEEGWPKIARTLGQCGLA